MTNEKKKTKQHKLSQSTLSKIAALPPRKQKYIEGRLSGKTKEHSHYALHRARDPRIFAKPEKIVGVITEDEIIAANDRTEILVTDGCYVFGVR